MVTSSAQPRYRAFFAKPNDGGYYINIHAVNVADNSSVLQIKVLCTVALLAIAVASYFVGPICLPINMIVFGVTYNGSLSDPARTSALHHVLCLAYIIHKWDSKDPVECKLFFDSARALHPLYIVVKKSQ